MQDCFSCEFADRDEHNRFIDRCSGCGNCHYIKFEGIIKPTLEECIKNLSENLNVLDNDSYVQGFKDALTFIQVWNEDE